MSDTALKLQTLEKDAVIAGQLLPAGTEVEITGVALNEAYKEAAKRTNRAAIAASIGDTDSLLGVTSDTAQLLLVEFASLVSRIANAKNLEEIKGAAKQSADKFNKLTTGVQRGDVKFPFQNKAGGEAAVLDEITTKAGMVASALRGEAVNRAAVAVSPSEDLSKEQPPVPYTPVN